jgi:chemotaxis protein MotB
MKRNKTMTSIDDETSQKSTKTAWMITFADFCTLLLTFFVMLVSMSALDSQAIRKALKNFGQAGGVLFFQKLESVSQSPSVVLKKISKRLHDVQAIEMQDIEEIQNLSEEQIEQLITSGKFIWYRKDEATKGLTFILNNDILFESGSAQLKPSAFPILDAIALFLKQSKYVAFVDGHTDNTPPGSKGPFGSNDELSFSRAKAVLDYLVDHCGVSPEKLAIGAYGDRMPIGDNSTPAGRAMNRRVEITLKPAKEV